MKLKNTTDFPDFFLRRMVSWCCRELDLPVRYIREAAFRNSRCAWGGSAYLASHRIGVRVGDASHFPTTYTMRAIRKVMPVEDRIIALVMVTAHELAHLEQYRRKSRTRRGGGYGGSEHLTDVAEQRVTNAFRVNREALLAKWHDAPKERDSKPKLTLQEQRSANVFKKLSEWERKLKTAQRKVREYRKKKRYYDGVTAAKR